MELTLVALLLDLDLCGEVLVFLPRNLGANGLLVDEITSVADLLLVVVGLLELLVGEEVIGAEGEGELETRLLSVEVRELDVVQRTESLDTKRSARRPSRHGTRTRRNVRLHQPQ